MTRDAVSTDCLEVDPVKLIANIRAGRWRPQVEEIRAKDRESKAGGLDPEEAKRIKGAAGALKKRLPGILWSGAFTQRNADSCTAHSGLLVADLDDVPADDVSRVRAAMTADPNVFCLFTSPSGTGLKIVFRVPANKIQHPGSYRAVERRVHELTGLAIDTSGKDLARLCFVSYDPAAYLNETPAELQPVAAERAQALAPPASVSPVLTSERVRAAERVLGAVQWTGDATGFATCPGKEKHTSGDGPRDCRVSVDGAPTISCFHGSCRAEVEAANKSLRSLVGKAEIASRPELPAVEPEAATAPPVHVPLVYDAGRPVWWIGDASGEFVLSNESGARRALKMSGFTGDVPKNANISSLDREFVRLTREENVAFAGPVAGWSIGVHAMAGKRVLVTSTAVLPPGAPGPCDTLLGIMGRMLGDDQAERFLLWLHFARQRLIRGQWHPLPAVGFVGKASAGKSYVQSLITRLLGGRVGKPGQYMQGRTDFNGDLFGAEHLSFEDESARTDHVSRRTVGENIKAMLFCRSVYCHAKNRQGVTLDPIWAMSLSINDDPEHLQVLPTIDASLQDKLLILKCEAHPRPVPSGRDETEWLTEIAENEIGPLAALVDAIGGKASSDSLLAPRTRVAGWQHPEVMQELGDLAPEAQLLSLVNDVLFASPSSTFWQGTADELSRELRLSPFGHEATRLLSWHGATGKYLARLEVRFPDRIIYQRTKTTRTWLIHPPG